MGIATLSVVALDCPDPEVLCRFYQGIVGGTIKTESQTDEWIRLQVDGGCDIGFQRVANYRAPGWPDGDPPQQVHLDFAVSDLEETAELVVGLGARRAEVQPQPDEWLVFLDPAGHPFCLILI
jgi:catechol 2,3-dioxygenase-like lactoylglutathione lyase family enzyme